MKDLLKQTEAKLAQCQLLRQRAFNEGRTADVEKLDLALEGFEISIKILKGAK